MSQHLKKGALTFVALAASTVCSVAQQRWGAMPIVIEPKHNFPQYNGNKPATSGGWHSDVVMLANDPTNQSSTSVGSNYIWTYGAAASIPLGQNKSRWVMNELGQIGWDQFNEKANFPFNNTRFCLSMSPLVAEPTTGDWSVRLSPCMNTAIRYSTDKDITALTRQKFSYNPITGRLSFLASKYGTPFTLVSKIAANRINGFSRGVVVAVPDDSSQPPVESDSLFSVWHIRNPESNNTYSSNNSGLGWHGWNGYANNGDSITINSFISQQVTHTVGPFKGQTHHYHTNPLTDSGYSAPGFVIEIANYKHSHYTLMDGSSIAPNCNALSYSSALGNRVYSTIKECVTSVKTCADYDAKFKSLTGNTNHPMGGNTVSVNGVSQTHGKFDQALLTPNEWVENVGRELFGSDIVIGNGFSDQTKMPYRAGKTGTTEMCTAMPGLTASKGLTSGTFYSMYGENGELLGNLDSLVMRERNDVAAFKGDNTSAIAYQGDIRLLDATESRAMASSPTLGDISPNKTFPTIIPGVILMKNGEVTSFPAGSDASKLAKPEQVIPRTAIGFTGSDVNSKMIIVNFQNGAKYGASEKGMSNKIHTNGIDVYGLQSYVLAQYPEIKNLILVATGEAATVRVLGNHARPYQDNSFPRGTEPLKYIDSKGRDWYGSIGTTVDASNMTVDSRTARPLLIRARLSQY